MVKGTALLRGGGAPLLVSPSLAWALSPHSLMRPGLPCASFAGGTEAGHSEILRDSPGLTVSDRDGDKCRSKSSTHTRAVSHGPGSTM